MKPGREAIAAVRMLLAATSPEEKTIAVDQMRITGALNGARAWREKERQRLIDMGVDAIMAGHLADEQAARSVASLFADDPQSEWLDLDGFIERNPPQPAR